MNLPKEIFYSQPITARACSLRENWMPNFGYGLKMKINCARGQRRSTNEYMS